MRLFALAALILSTNTALAHDSWLFAKDAKTFAFCTGEAFPASENATKAERVKLWSWIDAGGKSHAIEKFAPEGNELVARADVPNDALVVAVALNPHFIELAPVEFNEYVNEEGAAHVLEARRKANLYDRPGREYYTKFAKVALGTGAGAKHAVGHTLELVLASPQVGRTTEFRVLFNGQPKSGVRVALGREGMAPHVYDAVENSDAQGIVRFTIAEKGLRYLRAQVMQARDPKAKDGRPPSKSSDADWESFWASLTFRVF